MEDSLLDVSLAALRDCGVDSCEIQLSKTFMRDGMQETVTLRAKVPVSEDIVTATDAISGIVEYILDAWRTDEKACAAE